MSIEELVALLAFAAAMSLTPGPNTTLSAALAANAGLRQALGFVVAVPVGFSLLLLICAVGLGALVTAQPVLRVSLIGAGALYMLWMAWQLAVRRPLDGRAETAPLRIPFWQGVALQFLNIKAWMISLAISATWIAVDRQLALRLAQVVPLMMLYGLASNLAYALTGALLRSWLTQGRRLLWFNRAMALVLVVTALWMLRL